MKLGVLGLHGGGVGQVARIGVEPRSGTYTNLLLEEPGLTPDHLDLQHLFGGIDLSSSMG